MLGAFYVSTADAVRFNLDFVSEQAPQPGNDIQLTIDRDLGIPAEFAERSHIFAAWRGVAQRFAFIVHAEQLGEMKPAPAAFRRRTTPPPVTSFRRYRSLTRWSGNFRPSFPS